MDAQGIDARVREPHLGIVLRDEDVEARRDAEEQAGRHWRDGEVVSASPLL